MTCEAWPGVCVARSRRGPVLRISEDVAAIFALYHEDGFPLVLDHFDTDSIFQQMKRTLGDSPGGVDDLFRPT